MSDLNEYILKLLYLNRYFIVLNNPDSRGCFQNFKMKPVSGASAIMGNISDVNVSSHPILPSCDSQIYLGGGSCYYF
jgi:hypothetical protein